MSSSLFLVDSSLFLTLKYSSVSRDSLEKIRDYPKEEKIQLGAEWSSQKSI